MSHSPGAVLLGLLLVLSPAPSALTAQERVALTTGQRLRITIADSPPLVGRLVRLGADSMVFAPESSDRDQHFALTSVERIELSRGVRSSVGRGALIGSLGLGAIGGTIMFLSCSTTEDCPLTAALAGTAVSAALGAGIGALVGSKKTEHWTAIRVPGMGRQSR